MSFVPRLRDELVAAAEREQARRVPRIETPSARVVLTVAAAAATLLLLALVAGALDTRSVDDGPRPAQTPTPEARDLFGGTLVPDVRYETRGFVPTLSFEVSDDLWYAGDTERPDALVLDRRRRLEPGEFMRPLGGIWFLRLSEVNDPGKRGLDASRVAAPADLIDWMRTHPDLEVGPSRQVTVAGVPGESVDVGVSFTRPAHSDPFCRRRFLRTCTLLAPALSFLDGTQMRVTILATEPEPLVIMVSGVSARALATVEEAAAPVLESLRIG
jgi:hypothetical protein